MDTITPEEAEVLHAHHTREADFYLNCKRSNIENANIEPIRVFDKIQTKEDWLERAARFDKIRKYHRDRARFFLKIAEW